MKIKNPIYLTSILLIIGVAVVALKINPNVFKKSVQNYFPDNFSKFCLNDFCLNQENNKWFVVQDNTKIPADEDVVKIYIDKFKQINLNDLISQNKDKFSIFGIGDKKTILEINNKKLEIGNITSDTDGTYVLDDSGQNVYRIRTIFDKTNLATPDYWELKNLTKLPKLQTTKITVNFLGKTKEIVPDKNGKWEDDNMVNKLLNLERVNYLANIKYSADNYYNFVINTGNEVSKISVGEDKTDPKKSVFWASLDKQYFFEINKTDFDLLTQKLK